MNPPGAPSIAEHAGLAVYRLGAGEPVLFMPGPHRFERPGLRMADALIDGLTKLHREVVTFDPPGSGRSTRRARISMDEMIECTDEALDVAGIGQPVDAIGHSMGGFALIAYALARPARIRRLILVGTGAGDYLAASGALWNHGHPAFLRMALLGIVQQVWPFLGPEQILLNLIDRESFVDRRHAQARPVQLRDWFRPKAGHTAWHQVARKLDYHGRLGEIRAQTLILCGCFDPQFPMACSRRLQAGIAGSTLVSFEHSGHYPFIEEPGPFWAAVSDFLG